MKQLVRTLVLFAALAFAGVPSGAPSSSFLGPYRAGDCGYQCYNPTTGETVGARIKTSTYAACCSSLSFPCPAGTTFQGADFWVSSFGPESCP